MLSKLLVLVYSGLVLGAAASATSQPDEPSTGMILDAPSTGAILDAVSELVDAGHILHFLGVVDAYGHVSVRNPGNSSEFFMSASIPPAVATSQDIITYQLDNADALRLTMNSNSGSDESIPPSFVERFIHSEIYKAFPAIQAVVHSHTTEVLPFANGASMPLRAQMTTAAFIGTQGTPIFDASSVTPDDQLQDLLVRNQDMGQALARTLSDDSQIVLMRGHGMAVRGTSLRDVVFRAYYAKQNAIVQLQSMLLGAVDAGLTARQAQDAAATTESDSLLARAWQLWIAQVDHDGLYVNDLRKI